MSEISSSDSTWINEAVDRFERAWKAGVMRRIEDFLEELDEPRRRILLHERLRVELAMRQRANEKPSQKEYRDRFPKDHAVIEAIFGPELNRVGARVPTDSSRATRAGRVAAPSSTNPIPPELADIADYEISRKLGGGSMGLVFLAHNHIMGRDEVLKLISREIIDNPGVLDRFLREIRAVARLRHPNIVAAYSAFRAGGCLVFAMEYVQGLDLARMVKAKGPMPVSHACSFVHQAALALQHAHKAGMVHRDIKPGNLMLTHEGGRAIIKVLDFGIAKAGREQEVPDPGPDGVGRELNRSSDLTASGQMMGTPNFIAPEQIVDAQKADIRADIYSLGCTLYYLLSGRPPFEGATLEVLRAHRSTEAPPLNLVRTEIPAELAELVAKMMAKKPRRRFQEPAEVAKALTPFFKTKNVAVKEANPNASQGEQPEVNQGTTDPISVPSWLASDGSAAPAAEVGILAELSETTPRWEGAVELDVNVDDEWDSPSDEVTEDTKHPPWFLSAVAGSGGLTALLTGVLLAAFFFGYNPSKRGIPEPRGPQPSSEPPAPKVRESQARVSTPKTVVPKAETE
jgi:serine/threonine protein kinase